MSNKMKCLSFVQKLIFIVCVLILFQEFQSSKVLKYKNRENKYITELKTLIDKGIVLENEDIELSNYASIYRTNNNSFILKNSKSEQKENLIAETFFHKTILKKGWDKLSVNTYRGKTEVDYESPFLQAYLAGYLEGRMTIKDIGNFMENLEYNYSKQQKDTKTLNAIKNFFKEVETNMYDKISKFEEIYEKETDRDYFFKIYIFYSQLKGLLKGYNTAIEINNKNEENKKLKQKKIEDILLIQADGEIPELLRYFYYKINGKVFKLGEKNYFRKVFNIPDEKPELIWSRLMMKSRCSAMIKILKDEDGNYKDLLAGHNAWSDYSETYRTLKHYYMELSDYSNKLRTIESTFSSYPGCLSSTDDYYVTNNKLFVTETTLEVIDINMYNNVKKPKEYIPNFMRVNSATFFSKTAEDWVKNFSYFNSGTYSSQWMILDYKVFENTKNESTKSKKLLYVLEQTPNSMIYHDISDNLFENSYYASFNRAFFSETQESLNLQLIKELYGDNFTFKGAARRKIFKNLEKGIKTLSQFKNTMRYNGYKQNLKEFPDDPSKDSPSHGISSRYDLESEELHNLSGGIDCKITNTNLIKDLTSIVISGPTTDNNPNLTAFKWEEYKDRGTRIEGLPKKYEFDWILASPQNIKDDKQNDKYSFEN